MQLRRALHLVGSGALTGALLLGTAPPSSADGIRDRQWALKAFAAQQIWQHATGKGIVIAVVDTGVDASHPDLKGQVLKGKDFTEQGGNAQEDVNGHGTAMAGIIAGKGHGPGRNSGIKGLAPDAKILPMRIQHHATDLGVSFADGVRYAVDHGANVINISEVTSQNSREAAAIKYAIQHDVVVVAGSGNNGMKKKEFPAAYPGVLAVGGVDRSGGIWKGSSWGSNVSLLGPSDDNMVADPTSPSGYSTQDGTSDATAFVSASAALVRAARPDLTAGQVINRLIKTAKIPAGVDSNTKLPDPKFGYGIVRPLRAVTYDIPTGPKAGPLAQPTEGKSAPPSQSDKASLPADQQSASEKSSSFGNTLVYVLVALAVLVVLVVVIVLIVKRNKRDGGNGTQRPGGGTGPQGPGGDMLPMPHQGGQPYYQAPSGQFGPPPPNQSPGM